ncbi:hypothetical protein ACSQ67_005250 [Phaseolus vulgaris]
MSGMGDGYVGTAQDAVRIRRLEKQREAERRKIQELKTKSASAKGQPGLLQFGSSTSEGNSRLSFAEDIDSEPQEEEEEEPRHNNLEASMLRRGKLGKDPTVETGFLPDRSAEDSCSVSERLRSKQSGKGCGSFGSVSRNKFEVRKGDSIGEFLRAVQQQLAPEFREIRTTSVENLLYVKEDLIIPHQHSFYELIVNKARGKSGPLFHFDVHEDVRTIADATIEKDESHAGKVVERHWYEKNKHIFPASRWEVLILSVSYAHSA